MKGVYLIDKLENLEAYKALGPNFVKAIDFLKSHDLATLPAGRNEIAGDDVWANVDETDLVPLAAKKPEVHHRYFDIQIPLTGSETFGLARFDPSAEGSFDEAKDIGFYDQAVEPVTLVPGEFAVFYPGTCAHAPACTPDEPRRQRKIIVKVRA